MVFRWITKIGHLQGPKGAPILKIIKIWAQMCQTLRIKMRTITTGNSSKTWTKIIMEIHSNKCNNSQLSNEERTSLKGRDSWITRLTIQWIIKIKHTTKTDQALVLQVILVAHQLKRVTLSKKCKTLGLYPLYKEAKSCHHSKAQEVQRIRETQQLQPALPTTE